MSWGFAIRSRATACVDVVAFRAFLFGLAAFSVGCTQSYGLSPREIRGNDFSTLIYEGLPLDYQKNLEAPNPRPFTVGVIQAGEVAPPLAMLQVLRASDRVIANADALPGLYDGNDTGSQLTIVSAPQPGEKRDDSDPPNAPARRRAVNRMRALATASGLDYILLFGGTLDRGESDTPLSIFNLTIVGLYLFPSREIHADTRAMAALIDVHTGQVVMIVNAEAHADCLVPYTCAAAGEDGVSDASRERVSVALAKTLIKRLAPPCGK